MDYKISNICNDLSIGKSTIYKRISVLKSNIPEEKWNNNEYFYYTNTHKLFITDKGFEFIKNFKENCQDNNFRQNSSNSYVDVYRNELIENYKKRIEYLENENKRLLDVIAFKEQKELVKDTKLLDNKEKKSFFSCFFNRFKG